MSMDVATHQSLHEVDIFVGEKERGLIGRAAQTVIQLLSGHVGHEASGARDGVVLEELPVIDDVEELRAYPALWKPIPRR